MKLVIRPSYIRDVRRVRDRELQQRILLKIQELQAASSISGVTNTRRLEGPGRHYRIRIGDYRLGIAVDGDMVTLMRFGHRREFYRQFP